MKVDPSTKFSTPTDARIRELLIDRIDARRQSVGIVVGITTPEGRKAIPYGRLDHNDPRPLDGNTLFEIGSITKVFTSLLLADMVERGEVKLDDPVSKYLPPIVKMPARNGRVITLVDLATDTSGLPRMPSKFNPADQSNPYADYSVDRMYEFLSSYELTRDIASAFEYSNIGGGLLGHALAMRARTDYESLVCARTCEPLGLMDTRITLPPMMKNRLAVGHDLDMKAVPNWDSPALAGAGALRSTVNDLLAFLEANLGMIRSPLFSAMTSMLCVRRRNSESMDTALGWAVLKTDHGEIVWHNGGTGGYPSWSGYNFAARVGVVVLSNARVGVDDIGLRLIDATFPLAKQHKEVKVDPQIFDAYVGNYQIGPDVFLSIVRRGDHLVSQATRQAEVEIFAETEHDFFTKGFDGQITFVVGPDGRASELIVEQTGHQTRAKRVE